MQDYQRRFVDFLWECGAFRIGTFTLKSGRVSPTFVNLGLVEDGQGLLRLGDAFAGKLLEVLGPDGFDSVFGPAYKGVPLAVATAISLSTRGVRKPYLFDRKERKTHGEEASAKAAAASILVGHRPADGERIVMVDDVLTDGATKREALDLLRSLVPGARFPALLVAVAREEVGPDGRDALERFTADTGVPVHPAVTMTEALSHLRDAGRLSGADRERCSAYLRQYGTPAARDWR
ncbi:MAG: orotate phosphoribosyltransferase [Planctomycetes bacterium]|nr:orotate phosphoribosyltransferase [Planctomycetota bacterium]